MGLTVDGLRSRMRRGLVRPRRGNDGRLLVAVSAEGSEDGREPVHPGHEPIHDDEAERLSATVAELREEVMEARLAAGQAGAERDATNAMLADARARVGRLEAPSWPRRASRRCCGCSRRSGGGRAVPEPGGFYPAVPGTATSPPPIMPRK
jgi:hypothetical protein